MARLFRFLLIFALVGVCLAGWILWSMWRLTIQPEPFDSDKWKARAGAEYGGSDPGCYRGAMALGIIESRELIGKKSVALDALLAAPESTLANRWFYSVGQCAGDWMHYSLVITFDHTWTVVDAALKPE